MRSRFITLLILTAGALSACVPAQAAVFRGNSTAGTGNAVTNQQWSFAGPKIYTCVGAPYALPAVAGPVASVTFAASYTNCTIVLGANRPATAAVVGAWSITATGWNAATGAGTADITIPAGASLTFTAAGLVPACTTTISGPQTLAVNTQNRTAGDAGNSPAGGGPGGVRIDHAGAAVTGVGAGLCPGGAGNRSGTLYWPNMWLNAN